MRKFAVGLFYAGLLGLNGCAEIMSINSPDEIRQSTLHLEKTSKKSASDVSNCMKEALINYKDDNNKATYAGISFRDFEKSHDIMLRTPYSATIYGSEILFLIENFADSAGSTISHLWTHQHLLFGGSQVYYDRVSSIIRPCL
jgi:hypothetical protein